MRSEKENTIGFAERLAADASEKTAAFISEWPITRDALEDLYRHHEPTYATTIRELDTACANIDGQFKVLKEVVQMTRNQNDQRFRLNNDDIRHMVLGAIAIRDWGVINIDPKILDKTEDEMSDEEFDVFKAHVMGTLGIVTTRVTDAAFPERGIKAAIERETGSEAAGEANALRKQAIADILISEELTDERRIVMMVYLAASHHRQDLVWSAIEHLFS